MREPVVVSWGGGVNSTAMLVGLAAHNERPDAILFADTGGEKPETYAYAFTMQAFLDGLGFPPLVVVHNDGRYTSLEDNCLQKSMLPSLAYGFKSCSDKYKRRPQEKWAKRWPPAIRAWQHGKKVVKCLGVDAGEQHRAKYTPDVHYVWRYPLIEWGWDRADCVTVIQNAGLPVPVKSACFYCPASRKPEILALRDAHPDLLARALAMEDKARPSLGTVKGLGRRFAWRDYLAGQPVEGEAPPLPCLCNDEGDES